MKNIIYSPITGLWVKKLVPISWTMSRADAARVNDREVDAFLCGGGAEINACQITEVSE